MKEKSLILKYWPQYKWSNVFAMIKNSFKEPEKCYEDFNGLVVITGATSGIGYYTARKYASHGAKVLTINRDVEKSKKLCEELRNTFGSDFDYIIADLSKLDDMHRVGKALSDLSENIDVLIHNAGVYLQRKIITVDGIEMTFAVNYLASFVITYLLRKKLVAQKSGRIIFVNSEAYRFAAWGLRLDDINWEKRKYSGLKAYGHSKLAQLLSMIIFCDYLKNTGITINAMHPGMVRTGTGKENGFTYRWFKKNIIDRMSKSPEISAEALYYLGVSDKVKDISCKFFNLTTLEEPAPPAKDREEAQKLWDLSLKLGRIDET